MKKPLTKTQHKYYKYYCDYIREYGYEPSYKEMAIHWGKSSSVIWTAINASILKGYEDHTVDSIYKL